MEPNPPTYLASFTDTEESRICGWKACAREYHNGTLDEKAQWKRMGNSCNTLGETACWICGACAEHYCSKPTTQRRGVIHILTVDVPTN